MKTPQTSFASKKIASKKTITAFAALFAALLLVANAHADIVFAPLFRDNAVLQREKPVPVWGRADPGEKVTVTFGSQTHKVVADANGRWLVTLGPMPASAEPAKLVATGKNTVTVDNVLVGEVWICSGQSNMAMMVKACKNFDAEAAAANYPLIRHFAIPRTSSALPCDDVEGAWAVCSPETVGTFTAAGYFFARDLYKQLNVPIGLVNSSWGGTMIEAWMSPQALAADPSWPEVSKRWQTALHSYPDKVAQELKKPKARMPEGGIGSRIQPSAIYNAMIVPLLPAAIRGAIWYQGEANAGRHAEYRTLFPAMIRQWRTDFRQGDFPFYYVQLAGYGVDRAASWPFQREAQQQALKLPATGEALAIDIGEEKDIHPKNKQDVGHRLALIALANTYGVKNLEYSGPVYAGIKKEKGALRVKFTHAAGLNAKGSGLSGFAVAGADKKFVPATARIEGDTVVVSASGVAEPVAVRYAWAGFPEVSLYNEAGLPASSFRSDNWR